MGEENAQPKVPVSTYEVGTLGERLCRFNDLSSAINWANSLLAPTWVWDLAGQESPIYANVAARVRCRIGV